MKWPTRKLESLASDKPYAIVGGPFGSKLTSRDYVASGVPVIRGSNLTNGRFIDTSDFVFVSDAKVRDDLSSNLAKPGDLIFTQRGTLGQVALIPDKARFEHFVISQSQMKMTVDDKKASSLFLYYYFSNDATVKKIVNSASSSGVPHINLFVLRNFDVQAPPLDTQHAIVRILSAYDDLIENNKRRIQLLEESARLLYREWFVSLRFPGHEHVRVVDGVPEGWECGKLGDFCEEVRESADPNELHGNTPYIGLEHMPRRSISLNTWGIAKQVTSTKHRFRENDILFGKIRPYFHKVGVTFVDGVASSDALVIRPYEDRLHSLVLMTMSSDPFVAVTAQTMKEGSKMPRADWKQMQAYPLLLPPDGLLKTFGASIEKITAQLRTISLTNQKLAVARDLLLPRLMNGEIAV